MNLQNLRTVWLSAVLALIFASSMAGTAVAAPLTWGLALERIQFAPGATSAAASGSLPAYSAVRYVLGAGSGQLMEVNLTAPQGASLSVTTADGRAVTRVTGGATSFRGYLPFSGDYILTVIFSGQPGSYSLYVSIPQRVIFASGATSASLQGYVGAHQSHDYILRAQAGQLLEIEVTPASSLQLVIYGADGTVLRSGMGEGASFRGALPRSQDYIVTVKAGDQGISFSLNVIIPQRINFQIGAYSATVSGNVAAYQSQYYVLRAGQNQSMQVQVSPGGNVQLIVYGADGTVLKSGMGAGAAFTGRLPSSQDYILVVRAGTIPVAYQLWVAVY